MNGHKPPEADLMAKIAAARSQMGTSAPGFAHNGLNSAIANDALMIVGSTLLWFAMEGRIRANTGGIGTFNVILALLLLAALIADRRRGLPRMLICVSLGGLLTTPLFEFIFALRQGR